MIVKIGNKITGKNVKKFLVGLDMISWNCV